MYLRDSGDNIRTTTLYLAAGVPLDTAFAPQCRKEVSKVSFFPVDDLPTSLWGSEEFVPQLRSWLDENKPKGRGGGEHRGSNNSTKKVSARGAKKGKGSQQNKLADIFDEKSSETFPESKGELSKGGSSSSKGWSVDEMFAMNAK